MLLRTNIFFLICFFSIPVCVYSQAIYSGGSGDGVATSCYTQSSNSFLSIYNGGSADGFVTSCYTQADNLSFNIYKGGSSDGFMTACYTQSDNVLYNIYKGGSSDGFMTACYTQSDNVLYNIYNGGSSDGFMVTCYTQADNVLYFIYSGGVGDGYNMFCLGLGPNNVVGLPVELLLFNAIPYPDNVLLHWITASEQNSDYFEVEKSTDGLIFSQVGKVPAAGNSTLPLDYNLYDEEPLTGISYYRLKEADLNGQISYSNMIAVNYQEGINFTVYPNPALQGDFYVVFSKKQEASIVHISITNSLSQQILSKDFWVDKSGVIHIQQQQDLPPGIYNVNIRCDDFSNAQMLVVK